MIIILVAFTIFGYMNWIVFLYNPQFYIDTVPQTVGKYIEGNAFVHMSIILGIVLLLIALFAVYAIKDSKRTEMYDDGSEISFMSKDNLLSKTRIVQSIFLAFLLLDVVTCLNRLFTLDRTAPFIKVFERVLMIISFEFMAFYMIVFVGILVFEFMQDREKTYH